MRRVGLKGRVEAVVDLGVGTVYKLCAKFKSGSLRVWLSGARRCDAKVWK